MKKRVKREIIFVLLVLSFSCSSVFAADADTAWTSIWDLLTKWIIRVGAGITMFGGVSIGISFASDNPDARVRGLQFMAAGLIVMAVGAAPSIFGIV